MGITRVKTDTVMVVPVAPATCTASVLLAARVATRSALVAPAAKSDSLKTCVPFSVAESAVRLLGAESCMRTTYDPAPERLLLLRLPDGALLSIGNSPWRVEMIGVTT